MTARRPGGDADSTAHGLIVPDPRQEVVPAGWWQKVAAPLLQACADWTALSPV